jgi:16S rRNA (cytidine1402-2'-O)-methyltransferase
MVFYEAPHKLRATLEDLLFALGDRRIAIVRELTKVHEEVIRTTLKEAVERFSDEDPRGEIVLVIEGAAEEREEKHTPEQAAEIAFELMEKGLSASEAAKQAAAQTGLKKGEIYRALTRGGNG